MPNIGAILYESPLFVNSDGIPGSSWLTVIELYFTVSGFGGVNA